MGRHALIVTEAAPMAAPVAAPTVAPTWYHVAPPQDPARDPWTAINLLVPRQQTLPGRSLAWGIAAVLLNVLIVPAIFAIVYGILGVRRARRLADLGLGFRGRGPSIAGLVLGIYAAATGILGLVAIIVAISVLATGR